MTETWTFQCASCGQVVTRPLQEMSPDAICLDDGKPAVAEGTFARSVDDYWTGSTGRVLVNLADLLGTGPHPDWTRRQGCCGADGMDGPNIVCSQGHEVAVERSDCWMAHAAVLLPEVARRKT